jgi:hypothetical protein
MRFHARLLLGACGLALAVPAVAFAQPPGYDDAAAAAAGMPPQQQARPHHHKGLFGWRHCVECQRAYVKSHDGVDVPPPPSLGPGAAPGHLGKCETCQGNMTVSGPISSGDVNAPGYAMVGGPMTVAGSDAPGYAVVGEFLGGPEPAPVGVARSHSAPWADPRKAAMGARPGAGPYDPSVVATGLPPAQLALANPGSTRPHIISHLFGLPKLGRIRHDWHEQARDKHASIAYDQPGHQLTQLPSSMVYGRDNR